MSDEGLICGRCHGTGRLWVAYWLPMAGPGGGQVLCPECGGKRLDALSLSASPAIPRAPEPCNRPSGAPS
jgi:hypothetical protein